MSYKDKEVAKSAKIQFYGFITMSFFIKIFTHDSEAYLFFLGYGFANFVIWRIKD